MNAGELLWAVLLTVLCITCFPVNPLVLTGMVRVKTCLPLYLIAWITLAGGLVLVMAPMVMFPRRGGVPKGRSWIHTTRLVDTGIYAVVRHPQYTGAVYAIFLTNVLANPHWLFGVLGAAGAAVVYLSCLMEERLLVKKFGAEYQAYLQRVPGMNFMLGIVRLLRRSKVRQA